MAAQIHRIKPAIRVAPTLTRRELRNNVVQWTEATKRRDRRSYDSEPVQPPLISVRKESVYIALGLTVALALLTARVLGFL
jgi:hypothetical protein